MSTRVLQNDLDVIVASIASLPPIHKENTEVPVESSPSKSSRDAKYCRTKLYPVTTSASSLGSEGFDEHSGIYEVTIFVPAGKGIDEVNHFADLIISNFQIGTVSTDSELCIRIDGHSRGVGRENTNMYMLPVSIDYTCYMQRQ